MAGPPTTPTTTTLATPEGRVHVRVEGSGPPVVVVPGGPGAGSAHYRPWATALAARHTVVCFDQLGTGRSDRLRPPDRYGVGLYAATVGRVLDCVGAERAHVVGVSFGGIPAAEFAARHPARVLSLVLVDAQVDAEGWQRSNIDHVNQEVHDLHPEVWRELMQLRERGVRSGDPRYQDLLAPVLELLEWRRDDHPELAREPGYGFDVDTYLAFLGDDPEWTVGGAVREHEVLPRLRPHRLPTLLLTGRHDRVTVPAIAYRIAGALDPGSTELHVFEGSAHRPWAEEPEAFLAVVRSFLERHAPRSR